MSTPTSVLIVDDDLWCPRILETGLRQMIPDLLVTSRNEPEVSGHFDIYFIDDDFEGTRHATRLVRQTRDANPDALIIAFFDDNHQIDALMKSGCDAACDKGSPADLSLAVRACVHFSDAKNRRIALRAKELQLHQIHRHASDLFIPFHSF